MGKLAIVTFCKADNFGAMLQCYALQELLKNESYQVDILDINDTAIEDNYKLFFGVSIKNIGRTLTVFANLVDRYKRRVAFNNFRLSNLRIQRVDSSKTRYYDCVIFGSDQIWNFDITGQSKLSYLGDIPGILANKKISYAASIGKSALNSKELAVFSDKLKQFDKISVREDQARNCLSQVLDVPIEVNIDPVFLLDVKYWKSLSKQGKCLSNKDYILVYAINDDDKVLQMAKSISNLTNIPIIEISNKDKSVIHRAKHQIVNSVGPESFLKAIDEAKYIVTSSFHATALSIILEKSFYTIAHSVTGSRTYSLLNKLNLLNHYSDRGIDIDCLEEIDYTAVRIAINNERDSALKYLRDAFADIKEDNL